MSNIKIQDLSVGDWVLNEGDKYKVMGITMFGELDLWNSSCAFRTNVENVEPIPITEELLKKAGFVKTIDKGLSNYDLHLHLTNKDCLRLWYEEQYYWYDEDSRFEPYWTASIMPDDWNGHDWLFRVQYLHQLQHAMRMVGKVYTDYVGWKDIGEIVLKKNE